MANVDRVFGFKPVRYKNGAPYTGAVNKYFIASGDATAVFVGDLVKLAGAADTDGTCPTVIQAAAGDAVIGAVVAFAPDPSNLNINGQYRAASTNRYVYVADSPDLLFECQADEALAATDVGLNADVVVNSGSTTTARSGMELDASTKNTTSTLALKIRRIFPRVDNEVAADCKVEVQINLHQFATGGGDDGGSPDGVVGV